MMLISRDFTSADMAWVISVIKVHIFAIKGAAIRTLSLVQSSPFGDSTCKYETPPILNVSTSERSKDIAAHKTHFV